mgnify:CR=1 FL=1|jgi:amidase
MTKLSDWQEVVRGKLAQQQAQIPAEWHVDPTEALNVLDVPRSSGILSEEELSITETPMSVLLDNLASGKVSSEKVTLAFCKRAAIAHQLVGSRLPRKGESWADPSQVNCLTEILFDRALTTARELDVHLASTGQTKGPLHGLPVSLKDTFRIPGVDSTIGFVAYANEPEPEGSESEITRIVRESGGVLFCKT